MLCVWVGQSVGSAGEGGREVVPQLEVHGGLTGRVGVTRTAFTLLHKVMSLVLL